MNRLGGYEIIERLRAGGMATLYVARKHGIAGFSRKVALKVAHPHLMNDERFVRMFIDEARICAQLDHPNLVHVEELGDDGGVHFLAMEYIDGCSLRALFKRHRRLPLAIAVRIIIDVAAGLHAAHISVGEDGLPLEVIHRDISPTNILISRGGYVKLIDFGIAKARNRLTETEGELSVKGKLKYMAPEQAIAGVVDVRCDLFALGVVLWEALTGRELFAQTEDKIAFLKKTTAIAPPSRFNREVFPLLDALVLKLLAFSPDQRCRDADELRVRLSQIVPEALAVDAMELAALVTDVIGEVPEPTPPQVTEATLLDVVEAPSRWPFAVAFLLVIAAVTWLVTCHK